MTNHPNRKAKEPLSHAQRERLNHWLAAYSHWLAVGFSHETARALASVKWGIDEDVKQWARWIMRERTNLREEDMI